MSSLVELRSQGACPEDSCNREKEEREVPPTSVELLLNREKPPTDFREPQNAEAGARDDNCLTAPGSGASP